MGGQTESFMRYFPGHAIHFIENSSGLHDSHPIFWIPLAFTHAGLCGLLGNGLIRKYPRPNLAATLNVPRDRNSGGFDLATSDPPGLQRLETELAKRYLSAAIRLPAHAALLRLPKLNFLWCQHLLPFGLP